MRLSPRRRVAGLVLNSPPCSRRAASSIAGPAAARSATRCPPTTTASAPPARPAPRSTTRTRSTSSARVPVWQRQGAALPAQHRAALGHVDAAGRLHGARRNHRRGRACARPIEEAGAQVEMQGLFTLIERACASARCTCSTGRACSTPSFGPGRRRSRRGLFARGRDPLGRDRLPHVEGNPASASSTTGARGAASACTPSPSPEPRLPQRRAGGRSVQAPSNASAAMPIDLAERRMRMDRLADVDRVGAHLDRQRDLADHVAGVRADDAAADDAVASPRRTAAW